MTLKLLALKRRTIETWVLIICLCCYKVFFYILNNETKVASTEFKLSSTKFQSHCCTLFNMLHLSKYKQILSIQNQNMKKDSDFWMVYLEIYYQFKNYQFRKYIRLPSSSLRIWFWLVGHLQISLSLEMEKYSYTEIKLLMPLLIKNKFYWGQLTFFKWGR